MVGTSSIVAQVSINPLPGSLTHIEIRVGGPDFLLLFAILDYTGVWGGWEQGTTGEETFWSLK